MFKASDHSFVISAYGESPYIGECLASLFDQTIHANVLITTSTPNSRLEELSTVFNVPLYVSGNTPSIMGDWNFALSKANTPLVTIAHQDDVYGPNYLATMLERMNAAESPLIFFSNYGELRGDDQVDNNTLLNTKRKLVQALAKSGSSSDQKIKRRIISLGNSICCPSVTYNKPALPEPIFTSTMKSNLDWDAWERFSKLDGSFVYSEEILMYHRVHEQSETSRLIKDNTRTAEDLEMLSRFWPLPVAKLINAAYAQGQKSNS